MGEYGLWGNGGIFGSWGSCVKYRGNVVGVGKCVGVWGEVREDVGRCVGGVGEGVGKCVLGVGTGVRSVLWCGKVWEVSGMGVGVRKCVWGVKKCVWGVRRGVERVLGYGQCEERWGCGEVWGEG